MKHRVLSTKKYMLFAFTFLPQNSIIFPSFFAFPKSPGIVPFRPENDPNLPEKSLYLIEKYRNYPQGKNIAKNGKIHDKIRLKNLDIYSIFFFQLLTSTFQLIFPTSGTNFSEVK